MHFRKMGIEYVLRACCVRSGSVLEVIDGDVERTGASVFFRESEV